MTSSLWDFPLTHTDCAPHSHTYNYWKNDFNTHGTLSLCDIKSNDMWHLEKVTSPIRIACFSPYACRTGPSCLSPVAGPVGQVEPTGTLLREQRTLQGASQESHFGHASFSHTCLRSQKGWDPEKMKSLAGQPWLGSGVHGKGKDRPMVSVFS